MDERTYNRIMIGSLVLELILKYGLPAAMRIIDTWQSSTEPTAAEIAALRDRVPKPEAFFENPFPLGR